MLIKVCGMREPENIRQVAETGIDWMGFIFYARSARSIDNGKWTIENERMVWSRRLHTRMWIQL